MNTTRENGKSEHVPFDEELCERYLFGELNEAEQERFETAYFTDDSFFNNFLAVKDDILDLYARNELDNARRQRMEPHFISTGPRKKRLTESKEFIKSITHIADRAHAGAIVPVAADPEPSGLVGSLKSVFTPFRFAAAASVLVIVGIGLWLLITDGQTQNFADSQVLSPQTETANASAENADRTETAGDPQRGGQLIEEETSTVRPGAEPERASEANRADAEAPVVPVPAPSPSALPPQMARAEQPEPRLPEVAVNAAPLPTPEVRRQPDQNQETAGARTETVTLDSATRSATKRNTAEIGSATRNVVIRMVFGGEPYTSYSVRISTVGGGIVWRDSNMKTGMNEGTKSLVVSVPANSLTRKDYIVVLEGRAANGATETIREYYLRVDRQ